MCKFFLLFFVFYSFFFLLFTEFPLINFPAVCYFCFFHGNTCQEEKYWLVWWHRCSHFFVLLFFPIESLNLICRIYVATILWKQDSYTVAALIKIIYISIVIDCHTCWSSKNINQIQKKQHGRLPFLLGKFYQTIQYLPLTNTTTNVKRTVIPRKKRLFCLSLSIPYKCSNFATVIRMITKGCLFVWTCWE